MIDLLDRIGGVRVLSAAVDIFYDKALADPLLAPFFADADVKRLRLKQKAFLTALLTGSAEHTEAYMELAHAPLHDRGLNDSHFDAVARHMAAALAECNVPPALVAGVVDILSRLRAPVLGGRAAA